MNCSCTVSSFVPYRLFFFSGKKQVNAAVVDVVVGGLLRYLGLEETYSLVFLNPFIADADVYGYRYPPHWQNLPVHVSSLHLFVRAIFHPLMLFLRLCVIDILRWLV